MKYLKLTITAAIAMASIIGCKKDNSSVNYLKYQYKTYYGASDTTTITFNSNEPIVSENVTAPAINQDGGTILEHTGVFNGQSAILIIVTAKGTKGLIHVKWVYPDSKTVLIPFEKSPKVLNAGY